MTALESLHFFILHLKEILVIAVTIIAALFIFLLGGCCGTVKLYDTEKSDAEVAEITSTDTYISNIDGKGMPPNRCAKYSVLPGMHGVAARLNKRKYNYSGRIYCYRHYYSNDLKVFFIAEAGHRYETMPKFIEGEKWQLIIIDKNTGTEVQDIYQDIHIDFELLKKSWDGKILRKRDY